MVGVTAAIVGASVIGAGASMYGASKAAEGQEKAARVNAKQYQETKAMLSPYTKAGENALGTYNTALGLSGKEAQQQFYDDFQHDPGWEAANKAGADTVDDRYRLSGSSGGNMRAALYDYGQRNLLSAYQTRLSQLGGLVDTGRGAASALAGYGQQSAQAQGTALANAGMIQGQGITGAGQALAGGLGNLGQYNMFQQGMAAGHNPFTANNANRYFS
jgi:hypothetical protein